MILDKTQCLTQVQTEHKVWIDYVKVLGMVLIIWGYLLSYLMSPWIFVLCAIVVGMAFKKYVPKVYFLCTGGR